VHLPCYLFRYQIQLTARENDRIVPQLKSSINSNSLLLSTSWFVFTPWGPEVQQKYWLLHSTHFLLFCDNAITLWAFSPHMHHTNFLFTLLTKRRLILKSKTYLVISTARETSYQSAIFLLQQIFCNLFLAGAPTIRYIKYRWMNCTFQQFEKQYTQTIKINQYLCIFENHDTPIFLRKWFIMAEVFVPCAQTSNI
jgi:hypothetical protein